MFWYIKNQFIFLGTNLYSVGTQNGNLLKWPATMIRVTYFISRADTGACEKVGRGSGKNEEIPGRW